MAHKPNFRELEQRLKPPAQPAPPAAAAASPMGAAGDAGWQNLDLLCAQRANKIATGMGAEEDAEKLITEAAAVLAGQGYTALFLHLDWRASKKKPGARKIREGLYDLLKQPGVLEVEDPLAEAVSGDLDKLLLARRVLTQTLSYLRYRVKVKE